MAKPNKNAEHIRQLTNIPRKLRDLRMHPIDYPEEIAALNSAIAALRAEGKSPWRKVTKRYPGKKWAGKPCIMADNRGRVYESEMPEDQRGWELLLRSTGWFYGQDSLATHWQPRPEHPEKEVK